MASKFPRTIKAQSRRDRALIVVRKRMNFWSEQMKLGDRVDVDGKECDPEKKYNQALAEEASLVSRTQH